MIITCNNCNSRFNIDEKLIKPQGSKVKCSKCQTIFVVYPPPKEEEVSIPKPPVMPPLLDDDEDSGVDIEKDFAPKNNRPTRKPMFEEPDVVGGEEPEPAAPTAAENQPSRVPRRVPARSAGASTGSVAGQRGERPVRPAQRRPAPTAAAASADMPPKRTMPQPDLPENEIEDTMPPMDEDTFTDIGKTPKPVKGKRGAKPVKEKPVKEKPVKEKRERSGSGSSIKKLLLLILIIIILLAVAAFVLPKAGIEVPFLDKLNISQLLGGGASSGGTDDPEPIRLPNRNPPPSDDQQAQTGGGPRVDLPVQDTAGIQHFYMDPELVNSGILGNTSAGVVIIVEGLLQNNYDEPRKAIKIVGRLYNENYELEQEKIVYAGNLLTEEELVSLNPMEIENRLFTNGRDAMAPAKGSIPFMLVFSNIPEPISSYNYECELVSSESAAADMAVAP